jgi:sodium/potassium-transporting ATPase subunit alpha
MKKNKILCKSLKTVETLGAVSVLLSDKTGTLTKNQMVVTDCLVGFTKMTVSEATQKHKADDSSSLTSALNQIRVVAAVCNAGDFDVTTMNLPLADRKIIGDATDQAVLRFSESLSPVTETRSLWRKRFDLAFNSKNKFAICIASAQQNATSTGVTLSSKEANKFNTGSDMILTIKGAPDILLPRCSSYVAEDGEVYNLDDGVRTAIEVVKDSWSSEGKRVILLARKVLRSNVIRHDPNDGEFEAEAEGHSRRELVLVGLLGIVDPPRDEVPGVVKTLRGAGIRVMMVTGDFKLTAQAIARDCGIISNPPEHVHGLQDLARTADDETTVPWHVDTKSIVISGPELITMNQSQWDRLCKSYAEVVFARTTPEQKLRIVKEYKARKNIVAMTGDGVNDAPSLKEADIGIAPGSGSDIAIEAADMVLLESFSAIIEAVLYGRVVFDNLKKTIAYLLPAGSFSEFWPVMTSVLFGLPQILSSFLMIIICCFTDCAAATTLAYEKPEADVMLRPPRDPEKDKLVDWKLLLQSYGFIGVIETVASFSMAFWYAARRGIPFSALWFGFGENPVGFTPDEAAAILNEASSIYFVNLVVMQWFSLMAIRTRHLSIFSHPPAFNKLTQNLALFPAIIFAVGIAFLFCYIPGIQNVIGSTTVPVEYWFLPMSFGLGVLALDETRKGIARRWPRGVVARCAW